MSHDREPAETEVKTEWTAGLANWSPLSLSLKREITERYSGRGGEVLAQIDAPPDVLAQRLGESEALDAAFVAAVTSAASSALLAKRRLLGRLINQAVLDDAEVDHTELVVGILGQIDAPHVRALEAIRRAEVEAQEAGEVLPRAQGAEREINVRIKAAGDAQPPPVLAALVSLGLLESANTWDGTALVKGLTAFGNDLLDGLRDAAPVAD